MNKRNKWIIVFLIYADFRKDPAESAPYPDPFAMNEEMKVELDLLFKEIWTTPINPDLTRLFIIFNGIRYQVLETNNPGIQRKILFYEITNRHQTNINEFGPFQVLSDTTSGTTAQQDDTTLHVDLSLASILKKVNPSTEEKVFVITWDHGAGFGIFRQSSAATPSVTVRTPVYNELDRYPYLKLFWEKAEESIEFTSMIDALKQQHAGPLIEMNSRIFQVKEQDQTALLAPILNENKYGHFFDIDLANGKMPVLRFDKSAYFVENSLTESDALVDAPTEILLVEKVPEILSNDELSSAIQMWLGPNKKAGVLLMMNCAMMNMHAMFSFYDAVECFVAPQGNISIPGYNYRDILHYLNTNDSTSCSAQQLAVKCVETCENELAYIRAKGVYSRLRTFHKGIDSWKIIAVDLQRKHESGQSLFLLQVEAIKAIISQLNMYCNADNKEWNKHLFRFARSLSYDFTIEVSRMVDFINWLAAVVHADFFSLRRVNPLETKLINLKKITARSSDVNLILAMTRGKTIYEDLAIVGLEPTGYSIFFPESNLRNSSSVDQPVIDNVEKDSLLCGNFKDWLTFLNRIGCGITA